MNGVLKGRDGESANVRPLWTAPIFVEPGVSEAEAEIASLRAELDLALASLADRDERIGEIETEAVDSVRRAAEEGRALGLSEAERRSEGMLALLESGVSDAVDEMGARLADLERLAVLLARESLALIVGDSGQHSDLLARIIRSQMEKIESRAVVAVEVSAANFESEADVAPLLGRKGVEIRISEELGSGDCRIRLRLGTLEAGVGQQWDVIRAALDEMAGEGDR